MVKSFILDTNVILSSNSGGSNVLNGFIRGKDTNNIVIPGTVLTELDKHKTDSGETGYNARDFIRTLDTLREQGDLVQGVLIQRGMVIVEPDGVREEYLPQGFSISLPDNRIISTCIHLAKTHPDTNYVFVSNDVSCRVSADVCFKAANVNIGIESYKNDRVTIEDNEYKGYMVIDDTKCPDFVQAFYEDTNDIGIPIKDFYEVAELNGNEFYDNEYFYLPESQIIAVNINGMLHQIHEQKVFGLNRLYNPQQIMAMHALLAPPEEIPLVILTGSAGSGKTFLPVAAGIDQIYAPKERLYDRMIISRSNSLSKEEDLGFLPGDIDDKMDPLIQPVRDSVENLLRVKHGGKAESHQQIIQQVDDIFETCIDILPMRYIRGRSFVNKLVLLDEAQNVTKKQIFDIITRPGQGCKIVIVGDTQQIDNPYLDEYTSGLSFAKEKMRGSGVAIVSFGKQEIVRSKLARIATERMKG